MSDLRQFKLPDVGEGLTEADIVRWHVQPGDTVKVNQIIVEIETAKAVVELPSPHAGVVSTLLVAEGETVDVGTPIIAIDPGGDGPAPVDVRPLQTSTSADLGPPPPADAAERAPTAATAAGGAAPAPVAVPPLQPSTSAALVPPPPAEAAEAAEGAGKR